MGAGEVKIARGVKKSVADAMKRAQDEFETDPRWLAGVLEPILCWFRGVPYEPEPVPAREPAQLELGGVERCGELMRQACRQCTDGEAHAPEGESAGMTATGR